MRWGDARGRLRDDTNDGAHLKALPGRRGWRRRRVGRWDLRGRRGRRRGLNGAGRKEEAGRKDAQVDGGCRRRGSYRGRRAALSLGISEGHWPLFDEDRRKEESKLAFFGKQVEAFYRISGFAEYALHELLQHNNRLRCLARLAPGVHGADELGSMGAAKVLLENNQVGSRERGAQGELKAREPGIGEAAQLVDLRFEGRVCMLPRQHLNLIPYEASGRVVHNEKNAREVAISCPGDDIIAIVDALGFYGQRFPAER